MPRLEYLKAHSSSSIKTTDSFDGKNVQIDASAGSDVKLQDLTTTTLSMNVSSSSVVKFEQEVTTEIKTALILKSGGELYFQSLKTEHVSNA
ncbi:MAG: hypothetical protein ACI9LN_002607 [Saprospiraceae bacterium]|jgi:hypothetical protein